MTLNKKKIITIDDTVPIRTFMRIALEANRAEFYEAGTAEEGLKLCYKVKPDLVVLDLGLPDKDGLDILQEIKNIKINNHSPAIIILSVRKEQKIKDRAFELGADAYVTKPFLMEDLLEVIKSVLK